MCFLVVKNQTLNTLLKLLVEKSTELTADQRLRMGATILVEGILMASNPVTSIPEERLLRARNFNEFCKYPWGNLDFDYLRKEVERFIYKKLTEKDQYTICGFIYPIQLWELSSVNQLGTFFGIRDDEIQFPLCLHWKETKSLFIEEVNRFDQMEKVDVKCILGDPELHSDLVEDVDSEVDENNYVLGIDANDQEKIEFLTKKVVSLEEKVKYLEGLLNIRGETVKETEKSKETEAATKTKVNEQNADYELDEAEVLQNYIDAKRQEIAKVIEQPQEEEKQEVDVDDGDKESENSETNEGQTQEEEEQQQEDETEVNADVDVGAKESENPKTNEDASKKHVKGTKKRGRVPKGMKKCVTPPREVQQQVEDDAKVDVVQQQVEDDAEVDVCAKEIKNPETNEDGEVNEDASKKPVKGTKKRGRGTKGMKKCVTPPREVQQQVKDDAKVDAKESENPKTNEDGEVNEDASKKHVKFTKKRGRVTKEPNVDTSKSKRQKKQEDSAADVIGRVLEYLKKAD
ncbi:unnamed protein product [Brassica napus]|uniref:(rape) hypothetical protein n=1 Tax=Brassica napus TaxID=3708 RepID=A0A816Q355_BRANA|nr:unnamed protein product [Brassica napus]